MQYALGWDCKQIIKFNARDVLHTERPGVCNTPLHFPLPPPFTNLTNITINLIIIADLEYNKRGEAWLIRMRDIYS